MAGLIKPLGIIIQVQVSHVVCVYECVHGFAHTAWWNVRLTRAYLFAFACYRWRRPHKRIPTEKRFLYVRSHSPVHSFRRHWANMKRKWSLNMMFTLAFIVPLRNCNHRIYSYERCCEMRPPPYRGHYILQPKMIMGWLLFWSIS